MKCTPIPHGMEIKWAKSYLSRSPIRNAMQLG